MVLAVNGYDDSKEVVEKFVREKKLKQKVLLLGRRVARESYGVTGYPTVFVIDRSGKVIDREIGFAPGMAESIQAWIEKLLAGEPGDSNASQDGKS